MRGWGDQRWKGSDANVACIGGIASESVQDGNIVELGFYSRIPETCLRIEFQGQ
jgi:hypothetical protein